MNPGRGGEHQVAWCLPEILRLLRVPGRYSNEGSDLRPVYEEIGACVGSKDPTDVGGLQRAGGEPAEGDPVSLPARRSRTRGWPFRAVPGTGFGATTTGSAFSAHYNSRGTTQPEHHPPQLLDWRRHLLNRRQHQRPSSPTPLDRSPFRTP